MADQDLSHTAEIIKAAIPFVDSPLKGTAELFAKFLDLMGSLKTVSSSDKLAASGLRDTKIDFEGLLKGIRPLCSNKEREMVDRFLNFFNMKRAFEMYNNMMSMMKTMQEFGDFSFTDSAGFNDTDNVTGNFAGSPFESIFKNFSSNFNGNTSNTPFNENESQAFDSGEASTNPNPTNPSDDPTQSDGPIPNQETNQTSSSGTGAAPGGMNSMMFEMLKNMVPPEQKSSFENLSMLFNTMSYDNNSKSDDSKERNDG